MNSNLQTHQRFKHSPAEGGLTFERHPGRSGETSLWQVVWAIEEMQGCYVLEQSFVELVFDAGLGALPVWYYHVGMKTAGSCFRPMIMVLFPVQQDQTHSPIADGFDM